MTNWKNTFYLYKTISPFAYPLFSFSFSFLFPKFHRQATYSSKRKYRGVFLSWRTWWFDQISTFLSSFAYYICIAAYAIVFAVDACECSQWFISIVIVFAKRAQSISTVIRLEDNGDIFTVSIIDIQHLDARRRFIVNDLTYYGNSDVDRYDAFCKTLLSS